MSEKEGESSEGSQQASAVTASDVQELIRRKEEIEAQIKANYGVLESVSVGAGLSGGVGAPRRLWTRPHPPARGTGKPEAPHLRPLWAAERLLTLRTELCGSPGKRLWSSSSVLGVLLRAFVPPVAHFILAATLRVELCSFALFRDEETEALPPVTELISLQRPGD